LSWLSLNLAAEGLSAVMIPPAFLPVLVRALYSKTGMGRPWNDGIMEWWNGGEKMFFHDHSGAEAVKPLE